MFIAHAVHGQPLSEEPFAFYLTWQRDPTTTMTLVWLTQRDKGPSSVYYKEVSSSEWVEELGNRESLIRSTVDIHQLEIKGLEPATDYLFSFGKGGKERSFRTLSGSRDHPLTIGIGGDAYLDEEIFQAMNRQVASKNPDFIVMGGDIAYTEGLRCILKSHEWKVARWCRFFHLWSEQMVASDGRIIPIVPTIGNHDLKERVDRPAKEKILFYQFFPFLQGGIAYRVLSIGSLVSLYLLDSGHNSSVGGEQATWLKGALEASQGITHLIPAYHMGGYPTDTAYGHHTCRDIRLIWAPLFEKHGVRLSFEHDSHTFKRTYPIKKEVIDPEGIIYLGDGAWGVSPLKPARHWYLAKAKQTTCYWLVTIENLKCNCKAFDHRGEQIDEVEISKAG